MRLIENISQPRERLKKMDIMFYNSIKNAKLGYLKLIGLHTFKLIILIVFLIIDIKVLHSEHDKILTLIKLGIATCVVNLFVNLVILQIGYQDCQVANRFFLSLAGSMHHICPEEVIIHQGDVRWLDNCVSANIYNIGTQARNIDPALTPQIRARYESLYTKLIQGQIFQKQKSIACMDILAKMLSLATFIYGIVALATGNPNTPQLIIMITYLILEALNIITVIVLSVFVLFLPLICCLGCVYFMFFGVNLVTNRDDLRIPESVDATARIIQQTDGSCSVCLQNFALGEKLIVLSCSPNHAFHQNCIKSWLRVSNSCPICRSPLPQSI